ncbi:MAG: hypothetical protein OXU25_00120 [Thaumarchaeota archaeon]|nr:hypothetical protein [Nitrososphaerota archaeon]
MPRLRRSPEASAPGALTRHAFARRGGGPAPAGLSGAPGTDTARSGASRARRVARLAGFVRYLVRAGVLEDERSVHTFIGGHRLQKYAYIAQRLGMLGGYRFDFMKIGAFSADLAVDICALERGDAAPGDFGAELGVSGAFEGLVRRRNTEWLQVATFALRDCGEPGAYRRFVGDRRGHLEYDMATVRDAFAAVRDALAAVASAAGAGEGNGDGTA